MVGKTLMTLAMVTGLALGSAAFASAASAHGPDGYPGGYGMMGPGYGMGQGYGMGPGGYGMGPGYGMMGRGYATAPNMMGPGFGAWAPIRASLTVDDVRTNFERWLAWQGNPRLKLGTVKKDGDDTIMAEIVTKDGSLVDRYRVNRSTGAIWRAE